MTVYLMLSAGRGPLECSWAVAGLAARLEGDAARRGVAVRRAESVPGDERDPAAADGARHRRGLCRVSTLRSVVLGLDGPGAETLAAAWTGTLCWQAPSPYRPNHGRKNWYVTARRCSLDAPRTGFDETDVDVVPCRTGGPGGQRRNKVSTAVRATHRPSGLVVVVDTERQFGLNRSLAMRRLRERLEEGDRAAAQTLAAARWHVHDELIRGDPVRTERP
ncbi:peptide chain release factor-like protein [Dactylosporangium sp. McL0621]|uniref:peptide chain release factor-like protein n=1 Tax=Dactylosporangium sp. McL0621 TaxID=3415678 RepID=UPI003CF6BA66